MARQREHRGKTKSSKANHNKANHNKSNRNQPQLNIEPKTAGQTDYIKTIEDSDITFGIGPAGTGKTFLATSIALKYLLQNKVKRLILVRPAVEAGESLGFLPGDFHEKVDPYMRPIYDSLIAHMEVSRLQEYLDEQIIEIAPIAYMRGRTLSNAFVILDEAQNTTKKQMLMFLTRLGKGSKAVITGDESQTDLSSQENGLGDAILRLKDIDGVTIHRLGKRDIVRHQLIQNIIDAYES